MIFRQLFDPESSTYTYLLADEQTRQAVLIDPVLEQIDRDTTLLRELGLDLVYALDTHVHADHVTALGTLRERLGCKTVLSRRAGVGCADISVGDGDRIAFGEHALDVLETPGHTNGCLSYVASGLSMAFTGDALLIRGTGRTDFQQGDAATLYRSVHHKLFTLPESTLLYPGHDYKGRTVTTVVEERRFNPRLGGGKTEREFLAIMAELQLAYPKKMDIALPANLACGTPRGVSVTAEPVRRENEWAPLVSTADGVPEIAIEWVATHAGAARILDIRDHDEIAAGRIAGSEHVPLNVLEDTAARWDRSTPVVCVCGSGDRSVRATARLQAMGFTRVASMRGGMLAWGQHRLPVER